MKNTSEQNTKRNLCDTCKNYHDYPYCTDKMKFGDGIGGDNVYECENFTNKEKNNMEHNKTEGTYRYTEKDRKDFTQPADKLAKFLIGKIISHKISDGKVLRYRIAVTEAYRGKDAEDIEIDKECYYNKYSSGKAHKAAKMVQGTCFIYGGMIHIVCGPDDGSKGDNVLLRGIYEIKNLTNNTFDKGNGKPCISCEKLGLKSSDPFTDLLNKDSDIWIEDDGYTIKDSDKLTGNRINIEDDEKPWRFYKEIK